MNRELPKVSVVTITYGHEKYITETLDGVLMQKYDGHIEFIIANDNSPDTTDEVVKKYFLENPVPSNFEIKYTKHETNKGMMPNFIWAIEQATGEYIALCEGDDYWTDPLKLQKQVDFMDANNDLAFSFHNALRYIENKNIFIPFNGINKYKDHSTVPLNLLFKRLGGAYPTCSTMLRTMHFRKIPDYFFLFGVGDTPLLLLAITQGSIGYLADDMAVYRTSDNNWSNKNSSFEDKIFNYDVKISGIESFNQSSGSKYNAFIKEYINTLTYQIVFSFFMEERRISKKILFYIKYQKKLLLKEKIKSFIKMFVI